MTEICERNAGGNKGMPRSLPSPPMTTCRNFKWIGSVNALSPRSFRWRQTGKASPVSSTACSAFMSRPMPLRLCFVCSLKASLKASHRTGFIEGCRKGSRRPDGSGASKLLCKKCRSSPGTFDCSISKAVIRSSERLPFSVRFRSSRNTNNASLAVSKLSGMPRPLVVRKVSTTWTRWVLARHCSEPPAAASPSWPGSKPSASSAMPRSRSFFSASASRLSSSGVTFSWCVCL
mmetsp:Transcript_50995/g.165095  ORF Transcript_50995/g.165095 Transcript_50995/m.165095 type:complete len:233 (+) Transcript_50995:1227-1925(+)